MRFSSYKYAEVDKDAARELELYIENDRAMYNMYNHICENMVNKQAREQYDSSKAVKAFMYLVEAGAKSYTAEHGSAGDKWNKLFNKETREVVAKNLRDSFEDEADLGNMDHMLAKKYQKKKKSSYTFSSYKEAGTNPPDAHELELYIENTESIYKRMFVPICTNLIKKMQNKSYDSNLATKAFMNLVDEAAKGYAKEHGDKGAKWNDMFPMPMRKQVATKLKSEFEDEAKDLAKEKQQPAKKSFYTNKRANYISVHHDFEGITEHSLYEMADKVLHVYGNMDTSEGIALHKVAKDFTQGELPSKNLVKKAIAGLQDALLSLYDEHPDDVREQARNIQNTISNLELLVD